MKQGKTFTVIILIFICLKNGMSSEENLSKNKRDVGDEFKNLLQSLLDETTPTPNVENGSNSIQGTTKSGGELQPLSTTTSNNLESYPAITGVPPPSRTNFINFNETSEKLAATSTFKPQTSTIPAGIFEETTQKPPETTLDTLKDIQSSAIPSYDESGDFQTTAMPYVEQTTENPRCEVLEVLSTYCENLPDSLTDINYWDIYYTMLSDSVLDELLETCQSGHWCLYDKFDYFEALLMEKTDMVMKSEVFKDVCEAGPQQCLDSIVSMTSDCPTYPRVNFTKEAIDLICQLKKDPTLTSNCFEELLISLHVTVVDILRDQNQKEDIDTGFEDDTCKTPEVEMSKTFLCLEERCPNHTDHLAGFRNWKWFTSDVQTLKEECDLGPDTCISTYKSVSFQTTVPYARTNTETTTKPYMVSIAWTEPISVKAMIGISVGTFVTVIALTVLAFLCWKSHKKTTAKVGYSPLRNNEP